MDAGKEPKEPVRQEGSYARYNILLKFQGLFYPVKSRDYLLLQTVESETKKTTAETKPPVDIKPEIYRTESNKICSNPKNNSSQSKRNSQASGYDNDILWYGF